MTKKICLLIDDDPDELEIFEMALKAISVNVEVVYESDPELAVKKLTCGEIRPKYIFLDINMPKLTGWECLAQLLPFPGLSDVTFAMYSTSLPSMMPVKVPNANKVNMIQKVPRISELEPILARYFKTDQL